MAQLCNLQIQTLGNYFSTTHFTTENPTVVSWNVTITKAAISYYTIGLIMCGTISIMNVSVVGGTCNQLIYNAPIPFNLLTFKLPVRVVNNGNEHEGYATIHNKVFTFCLADGNVWEESTNNTSIFLSGLCPIDPASVAQ